MLRSTEEVVALLRDALTGVGVVLPSLCVDPVTGASDEPFALVVLGRCNVRTAEKLASVLRGERPPVGAYVVDVRDGQVGEVMGHVGGKVQLRPVGGGREWDCPPESTRPAAQGRYCGRGYGRGTVRYASPETGPRCEVVVRECRTGGVLRLGVRARRPGAGRVAGGGPRFHGGYFGSLLNFEVDQR